MLQNTIDLGGLWKTKGFDYCENAGDDLPAVNIDDTWIDAEVPGDIHDALFRAGMIKDPYYADNSKECGWVTEKDWYYYKTFRILSNFQKEKTRIVFEGIDTYGEVWLNGQKVGSTDNMFREFVFDVTGIIKEDAENELVVRINSIKRMMRLFPYQKYFACFNPARIFIRKAQCHFGWDWAPDLPATGIWQKVKLVTTVKGEIENVRIKTGIDGKVSFLIKVDRQPTINDLAQSKEEVLVEKIEDELLIRIGDGQRTYEKKAGVRGGKNHLTMTVENPRLWWPHGSGEPFLYHYDITLFRKGLVIDQREGKFGIREVELRQDPLAEGGFNFQFRINKIPVYCKGANWVPLDCFTGTVQDQKYANLIKLAKEANFNMLRIWGGGFYEKELFYDLCDENGIMVWQDFMFACSDAPDDHPEFINLVIPEVEYQVQRLRNHPSIVYWCGGNEKTGSAGLKESYGDRLLHYIIRGICNDLDSTRPYGAASPTSFSDLGNDQDSGDTHCNCLEHSFKKGMTGFREEIEKIKAMFTSECAIQGPARYQSMARFIPEDQLWPLNDLWRFRYKDNPYNTLVEDYLDIQKSAAEILFGECNDVKDFLKKAMTAHAEILKAEIEHQRRRKWVNSGFMFWMYSDIWPTGTWAVVDYYQVPKPAYYSVMRAFQPLLVSIRQLDGGIKVTVVNDLLDDIAGSLELGQSSLDGRIIWHKTIADLQIPANEKIETADLGDLVQQTSNTYLFARFNVNGKEIRATFFPNLWKEIQWPEPGLVVKQGGAWKNNDGYLKSIEISAKKYARMVNINLPDGKYARLSDNFFDLEAGESRKINIISEEDYDPSLIRIDHWLTEWV